MKVTLSGLRKSTFPSPILWLVLDKSELGFPSQPGFSTAEFSKYPEHSHSRVLHLPLCMLMHFFKNP